MIKNPYVYVLNSKVTALNFNDTVLKIEEWINKGEKQKYVSVCNTHSLVTASKDEKFNQVLASSEICTPDGMPLVWALRACGYKNQDRVDGPNLMLKLCEKAQKNSYKIFLYGGTKEVLELLNKHLKKVYPNIEVVGSYSPPFRSLTEVEKQIIQDHINASNADIVFVSLGCPKQEIWMHDNTKSINSILIGVGAAFNFIIGDIKRPPIIFQKLGLEWFFRLVAEPKRLWKRYLYNNTLYIIKYIKSYRRNKKRMIHIKESQSKNSIKYEV